MPVTGYINGRSFLRFEPFAADALFVEPAMEQKRARPLHRAAQGQSSRFVGQEVYHNAVWMTRPFSQTVLPKCTELPTRRPAQLSSAPLLDVMQDCDRQQDDANDHRNWDYPVGHHTDPPRLRVYSWAGDFRWSAVVLGMFRESAVVASTRLSWQNQHERTMNV